MNSNTFKSAPPLGLRSKGLYFLATCYLGYRWRVEFLVPLLTLLQLQSYLVPCISAPIFIIPKSRNIHWRQIFYAIILGELLSLSLSTSNIFLVLIVIILLDLPHFLALSNVTGALWNTFPELFQLKWIFIYFNQFVRNALYVITQQDLCLIHWKLLSSGLRFVSKWMQPTTSNSLRLNFILFLCIGTWFRATGRLVRAFQGWNSSTQKKIPSSLTKYVWLRYECFAFYNDVQSQSQYTLILLAL